MFDMGRLQAAGPRPIGWALAGMARSACGWLASRPAAAIERLCGPRAWQFETIDLPEFRTCSAVERSAALAAARKAACPEGATTQAGQIVVALETESAPEAI